MRRFYFLVLILPLLLPAFAYADTVYTIQKGDSLCKISKKFGVSINEIKARNNLTTDQLKQGKAIVIPTQDEKQSVKADQDKKVETVKKADPTAAKAAPDTLYHTVRKGETLSSIARKYSIAVSELKELNNLKSTKIKPKQQLLVKRIGPKTYTVKKGDTILKIARKFNMDPGELKDLNELDTDSLKPGQKLLLEPEVEQGEFAYYAILSEAHIEEEMRKVTESGELSHEDKLILMAKKLLNIPYRFGGNSLLGIDCSAYVKKVYGMIGIDLPRSAREQFKEGDPIEREDLAIGDLVFFRTYASFPSHVGIYLGNDLFIHASSKERRVTINSLNTPYYFKRFIGAKRVIEDAIELQ